MGNNEVCWRNGSCSNEYHCVFHMEGCVLLSYGFQLHRHYKRPCIHVIALQAVQKSHTCSGMAIQLNRIDCCYSELI